MTSTPGPAPDSRDPARDPDGTVPAPPAPSAGPGRAGELDAAGLAELLRAPGS
jgi:hypothetical protein